MKYIAISHSIDEYFVQSFSFISFFCSPFPIFSLISIVFDATVIFCYVKFGLCIKNKQNRREIIRETTGVIADISRNRAHTGRNTGRNTNRNTNRNANAAQAPT